MCRELLLEPKDVLLEPNRSSTKSISADLSQNTTSFVEGINNQGQVENYSRLAAYLSLL